MDVGTAVAGAWSSGISVYGVAALLGIVGRLGWVDTPAYTQRGWFIAGAVALFLAELVIDKVPLLDSAWDAVHTVIRPVGGAALVNALPHHSLPAPVMLAMGAGLALTSHSAKASARALINTSPEPVSNVVASVSEDGLVAAVMTLAFTYPRVAIVVTLALAVVCVIIAVRLIRAVRSARARLAKRLFPTTPPRRKDRPTAPD